MSNNENNNNQILIKIAKEIGTLNGKVDGILNRLDRINGRIDEHGNRINKSEGKIDDLVGKATVIGAIGGFVIALVAVVISFFKK